MAAFPTTRVRQHVPWLLITVWVALLLPPLAASAQQQADTPPAVGVSAVKTAPVSQGERFVGRAEAIDRVELRARVTGFLEERRFDEGGRVEKGDVLFVIEKDQYQATLDQREAELASAQAQTVNAEAQLARAEELVTRGNIPEAEVDERRAAKQVADAAVLEAQAAIEQARLDLGYTEITAPVSGRISRAAYSVGALVGPDSGALATIVSEDPIYVSFPVSEALMTQYRRQRSVAQAAQDLVVRVVLPDGSDYGETGSLAFTEVEVDESTDTLTVRARFPNPDGILVPGQFLDVIVEEKEPDTELVMPAAAMLVDKDGTYVLVVGDDNTAQPKRVTLGDQVGTNLVVRDGLSEGERVIVQGMQKVRSGQTVQATVVDEGQAS
ncbi:MAG: efflux RND transporter periplasmic adaptor subunit [Geminicoccaceae bacterium]